MPIRTTPGGILYEELEGSPTFRANDGGMTAIQKWKIEWDQIDALMEEGFPRKPAVGDTVTQTNGLHFPGKDWLDLANIAIDPFKGAAPSWDGVVGHNKYDKGGAVATLTYGMRGGAGFKGGEEEETDPDDEGILASRQLTMGGEFLVLPNAGLKVEVDKDLFETIQNEDVRAGKFIPTVEHTLTLHRVPEIPFNTIVTTVGKVNEFQNLFGAPIETLLYLGARASRDKTTRGDTMWQLEHRWTERIVSTNDDIDQDGLGAWVTWNHYWIPEHGKWLRIWTQGNERIYPLTSFAPLFKPDIFELEPGFAGDPPPDPAP